MWAHDGDGDRVANAPTPSPPIEPPLPRTTTVAAARTLVTAAVAVDRRALFLLHSLILLEAFILFLLRYLTVSDWHGVLPCVRESVVAIVVLLVSNQVCCSHRQRPIADCTARRQNSASVGINITLSKMSLNKQPMTSLVGGRYDPTTYFLPQ